MQPEVILPLIAYLLIVFGLSVYAMRKRATGNFLNEYFLGSRSMGGVVLAMTLTATYISASSFIGGPGAAYKYNAPATSARGRYLAGSRRSQTSAGARVLRDRRYG